MVGFGTYNGMAVLTAGIEAKGAIRLTYPKAVVAECVCCMVGIIHHIVLATIFYHKGSFCYSVVECLPSARL